MKGTAFLFAAYDGGMDTMLLLFLLVALDKDPALKDTLKGFLGFYKENRELISAVLKNASEAAAPPAETPCTKPAETFSSSPEAEKKSRPEQDGSLRILEEYLKRCEI